MSQTAAVLGVVVPEVHDQGPVRYVKFQTAVVTSRFVLPAKPEHPSSYSDCVYMCPVLIE